jgi:hypothetical protein
VDARLLKVIDTDPENGPAIVGFALWSLPTSPVGKTEIETLEDGFSPPWPESCDGEFCERFFGANHERQAEVMGERVYYCIFLFFCFSPSLFNFEFGLFYLRPAYVEALGIC